MDELVKFLGIALLVIVIVVVVLQVQLFLWTHCLAPVTGFKTPTLQQLIGINILLGAWRASAKKSK
jgi:hypothetical protein